LALFDRVRDAGGIGDAERELVEALCAVARTRIAPRAARHDEDESFPWDNVEDLRALGLNQVFVPSEYGGIDASYRCYLRLVEELAEACASTSVIWATTYHAVSPVIDHGTAEQRSRFLPGVAAGQLAALAITEGQGGSDATRMTTTITPDGDSVQLSGSKAFITNGDVADLYLVFGKWSELGTGRDAITAVLVEGGSEGLAVGRKERKLGHRASSTVELHFDDVQVSRANVLGKPGEGLQILRSALNKSRPSVAAQALGIARAAFLDGARYANSRPMYHRLMVDLQSVQFTLARLASRLAQAEAWLQYVASLVEQDNGGYAVEASIAKLAASDLAMEAATQALQLHGGLGYTREARIERLFRDAKLTQIWEGANELHLQLIGRSFKTDGVVQP
jgi:alkylation response protein AidB-like acyl-CoA dehydrogenase